jgi:alpha-L-rhamnosidase
VEPVGITTSPSGKTIIDFGQNLVGRLRINVEGPAGTTITMRHAEVLDAGELCTILLRKAECTDRYTLRGGGPETWEPRFTFHGFRYAEVTGWPGEIQPANVVAVVCHSDMQRTGWFECSDARINRLHENIVWGMRGNFLDIPTDCPQRDERLGWTGDLCVFSPTATFLYECAGFLTSWLRDLAADQHDDGMVPVVIPDVVQRRGPGPLPSQPAWGDAAVIVPWVMYQRFGDLEILRAQWPSMRAWVDHVLGIAGDAHLWNKGFMFADWLDPSAPASHPADARTDPHLVATAYLARTTEIMAATARLLGDESEAARYAREHDAVVDAFNREFVSPTGRVVSDSQTGYALALQFGLIGDPEQRARAAKRLQSLVRHAEFRIATGFVGTPLICDALCDAGEEATAFALLTQEACPSWLYPVSCGATTVWERWDGLLPDGSVNLAQMNSFNHYALGAVGDWLHRTVGGLAPSAPGYRRMTIRPIIGGDLSHASSRHVTPYGPAESSWRADGDLVDLSVEVPPNTTAVVVLPDREPFEVGSGRHHWEFKRN